MAKTFEHWFAHMKDCGLLAHDDYATAHDAWNAGRDSRDPQAIRRAALEEAAQVCDWWPSGKFWAGEVRKLLKSDGASDA